MPLYMGSLFYHLNKCVNNIVRSTGCYDTVTHVDTTFLQILLEERFGAISPKPHEFPTEEMGDTVVRGIRTKKPSNLYKSRAWRWANVKQANKKVLKQDNRHRETSTSDCTPILLAELLQSSFLKK